VGFSNKTKVLITWHPSPRTRSKGQKCNGHNVTQLSSRKSCNTCM